MKEIDRMEYQFLVDYERRVNVRLKLTIVIFVIMVIIAHFAVVLE